MSTGEVTQISDVIGNIRKYQIIALLVLIINEATIGIMSLFPVFMFLDVTLHWDWDVASNSSNVTYFSASACKIGDVLHLNSSSNFSNANSRLIYDSQYSPNTLTEKFGLVCEKNWLVSLTKGFCCLGTALGSLIVGRLTERFGRSRIGLMLFCLSLVSNLCLLFTNNYIIFCVACLAYGIGCTHGYTIFTVQVLEILPNSRRPVFGTLGRYGYAAGQALIAGVSFLIKDWFYIQTFQTAYVALSIPISCYVLDSPVWLMVKGRAEDAKKNIMIIARRNGLDLKETERKADLWISSMKNEGADRKSGGKGNFTDLFKNRIIAKYTVFATVASALSCLCLTALYLNIEAFGSGLYQDFFLCCGMMVIGIVVTLVALTRYSIKRLQIICLIIAGIDSFIYIFTNEFVIARTVATAVFRGIMTPILCTLVIYATEIFPTSVRVVGISFQSFFNTIVLPAGPFAKDLGEKTHVYVPFILFSAMTFLSAFLLCFLPETRNKPLIHNVDDLIKKKKKEGEEEPNVYTIDTKL